MFTVAVRVLFFFKGFVFTTTNEKFMYKQGNELEDNILHYINFIAEFGALGFPVALFCHHVFIISHPPPQWLFRFKFKADVTFFRRHSRLPHCVVVPTMLLLQLTESYENCCHPPSLLPSPMTLDAKPSH